MKKLSKFISKKGEKKEKAPLNFHQGTKFLLKKREELKKARKKTNSIQSKEIGTHKKERVNKFSTISVQATRKASEESYPPFKGDPIEAYSKTTLTWIKLCVSDALVKLEEKISGLYIDIAAEGNRETIVYILSEFISQHTYGGIGSYHPLRINDCIVVKGEVLYFTSTRMYQELKIGLGLNLRVLKQVIYGSPIETQSARRTRSRQGSEEVNGRPQSSSSIETNEQQPKLGWR